MLLETVGVEMKGERGGGGKYCPWSHFKLITPLTLARFAGGHRDLRVGEGTCISLGREGGEKEGLCDGGEGG